MCGRESSSAQIFSCKFSTTVNHECSPLKVPLISLCLFSSPTYPSPPTSLINEPDLTHSQLTPIPGWTAVLRECATGSNRDSSRTILSLSLALLVRRAVYASVKGRERRIPKSYQAAEGEKVGREASPGVGGEEYERRETGGEFAALPQDGIAADR
ncbi:hypothetical protein GBAR_LOCUS22675 [Geodia barretti]|uniref:Uncharacterized protein n=1 Tax=Geodia barretti TaxID=519541 RepID=A0AA35T5K4_GEOBA|nr:hypothetical protein GBAR_LOCUS22675 [Geodia barretti]